jgi:hypothetical protein
VSSACIISFSESACCHAYLFSAEVNAVCYASFFIHSGLNVSF